jgi:hypothetical protein
MPAKENVATPVLSRRKSSEAAPGKGSGSTGRARVALKKDSKSPSQSTLNAFLTPNRLVVSKGSPGCSAAQPAKAPLTKAGAAKAVPAGLDPLLAEKERMQHEQFIKASHKKRARDSLAGGDQSAKKVKRADSATHKAAEESCPEESRQRELELFLKQFRLIPPSNTVDVERVVRLVYRHTLLDSPIAAHPLAHSAAAWVSRLVVEALSLIPTEEARDAVFVELAKLADPSFRSASVLSATFCFLRDLPAEFTPILPEAAAPARSESQAEPSRAVTYSSKPLTVAPTSRASTEFLRKDAFAHCEKTWFEMVPVEQRKPCPVFWGWGSLQCAYFSFFDMCQAVRSVKNAMREQASADAADALIEEAIQRVTTTCKSALKAAKRLRLMERRGLLREVGARAEAECRPLPANQAAALWVIRHAFQQRDAALRSWTAVQSLLNQTQPIPSFDDLKAVMSALVPLTEATDSVELDRSVLGEWSRFLVFAGPYASSLDLPSNCEGSHGTDWESPLSIDTAHVVQRQEFMWQDAMGREALRSIVPTARREGSSATSDCVAEEAAPLPEWDEDSLPSSIKTPMPSPVPLPPRLCSTNSAHQIHSEQLRSLRKSSPCTKDWAIQAEARHWGVGRHSRGLCVASPHGWPLDAIVLECDMSVRVSQLVESNWSSWWRECSKGVSSRTTPDEATRSWPVATALAALSTFSPMDEASVLALGGGDAGRKSLPRAWCTVLEEFNAVSYEWDPARSALSSKVAPSVSVPDSEPSVVIISASVSAREPSTGSAAASTPTRGEEGDEPLSSIADMFSSGFSDAPRSITAESTWAVLREHEAQQEMQLEAKVASLHSTNADWWNQRLGPLEYGRKATSASSAIDFDPGVNASFQGWALAACERSLVSIVDSLKSGALMDRGALPPPLVDQLLLSIEAAPTLMSQSRAFSFLLATLEAGRSTSAQALGGVWAADAWRPSGWGALGSAIADTCLPIELVKKGNEEGDNEEDYPLFRPSTGIDRSALIPAHLTHPIIQRGGKTSRAAQGSERSLRERLEEQERLFRDDFLFGRPSEAPDCPIGILRCRPVPCAVARGVSGEFWARALYWRGRGLVSQFQTRVLTGDMIANASAWSLFRPTELTVWLDCVRATLPSLVRECSGETLPARRSRIAPPPFASRSSLFGVLASWAPSSVLQRVEEGGLSSSGVYRAALQDRVSPIVPPLTAFRLGKHGRKAAMGLIGEQFVAAEQLDAADKELRGQVLTACARATVRARAATLEVIRCWGATWARRAGRHAPRSMGAMTLRVPLPSKADIGAGVVQQLRGWGANGGHRLILDVRQDLRTWDLEAAESMSELVSCCFTCVGPTTETLYAALCNVRQVAVECGNHVATRMVETLVPGSELQSCLRALEPHWSKA